MFCRFEKVIEIVYFRKFGKKLKKTGQEQVEGITSLT